jgi:hypothetical protein
MMHATLLVTGQVRSLNRINYEDGILSVCVVSSREGATATITFENVVGFRVLDEGDMLEFWPNCSYGALVWQIHEGGWFSFERHRSGLFGDMHRNASEFLIASEEKCVNIISHALPRVSNDAL